MGGHNVKNTIVERLVGLLTPNLCCGCGRNGSILCGDCKYDIISEPFLGCVACGAPQLSGICVEHGVAYERAWVVGTRQGVLRRLIDLYKFQRVRSAVHSIAELLDARLPELPSNAVIVPVPTARSHIRQRGYDHCLLIALQFAWLRGLDVSPLLERVSNATQHLVGKK